MDANTANEIRKTYGNEYYRKGVKDVPGLAGWVARGLSALYRKIDQWEKDRPLTALAAHFACSALPVFAAYGALVASVPLGLCLIAASVAVGVYTHVETKRVCNEALKRDIGNGTLAERYKADVLTPKLQGLEQQMSSLPSTGTAKSDFTDVTDTAQKSAADEKPQVTLRLPPPGM